MGRKVTKNMVAGQPIQWHLNTSKHDLCPECGKQHMAFLGRRRRHCMECNNTFRLVGTTQNWYKEVAS